MELIRAKKAMMQTMKQVEYRQTIKKNKQKLKKLEDKIKKLTGQTTQ